MLPVRPLGPDGLRSGPIDTGSGSKRHKPPAPQRVRHMVGDLQFRRTRTADPHARRPSSRCGSRRDPQPRWQNGFRQRRDKGWISTHWSTLVDLPGVFDMVSVLADIVLDFIGRPARSFVQMCREPSKGRKKDR
jgi:hypothetical protein